MGWAKVCDVNSLKDGDLVNFSHDDGKRRLIIAKIKGKLYATGGICTHAYAELSNGFLNEEEKTVTCPLHLSAFDLQSGIPRNASAEIPLKTYQVKEEADGIYVLLE
jgi:3-phenylpropionate/trans-cinnamate dioxygenase ferredoxin subunit